MNTRPLKTAGLVSLILGILFIVAGVATWGVVSTQLAAEKITVPGDAAFLAGQPVTGPLTAYAQADTINHHALEASNGMTYAELGVAAREAQAAGDTAKAEELTQTRTTVMNASFLRASLFTSVVAFGVALMAVGVGVALGVVGWGMRAAAKPARVADTASE